MKKAIIYARVSTSRQAKDELPIQSQIEQCEAKAKSLGANVEHVFKDEGISGRGDNRPQFQSAIEYCENCTVDYFITWSTSRFARNKIDAALYKIRLQKAGVQIAYTSMNIDRDTDSGWVTESIMELFDELYSRQIAADTRRSMIKNARDGYWNGGRPPYGFLPEIAPDNPKRKKLVVNPEEAYIVKEIFDLRVLGSGAKTIAGMLDDRGLKNREKKWTKKTITALLRNPAVIGQTVFGRRDPVLRRKTESKDWIVTQSHESIIDSKVWTQVQKLMDDDTHVDKGSPKSTFFFTGLLKCGDCGASLKIETATGRNKTYSYYNCSNAQQGTSCKNRRIPARDLDQWLVDVLFEDAFTRENLLGVVAELNTACSNWASKQKKKKARVAARLEHYNNSQNRIYELFELHGKKCPNLEDLTLRLRANKKWIKKLEAELALLEDERQPVQSVTDSDVDRLVETLKDIVHTSQNPSKIRHFFGTFVSEIAVNADDVKIDYDPTVLLKQHVVHSERNWLPVRALLRTKTLTICLDKRFRKAA